MRNTEKHYFKLKEVEVDSIEACRRSRADSWVPSSSDMFAKDWEEVK